MSTQTTSRMILSRDELSQLRSRMPRGYLNRVIDLLALTGVRVGKGAITEVIKGRSGNTVILEAIVKVAAEHDRTTRSLKQQVNKIIA